MTLPVVDATADEIALLREPAVIGALPTALRQVPDDRDAFYAWRREVMKHRVRWHDAMARATEEQRTHERERCRRDAAYFVLMYGNVFEPRSEDGATDGGFRPFIPYAFQVRMIRAMDHAMKQRGVKADLAISKSRDMGASWICCLWALHGWLFRTPFIVGMVSRKESLVDNEGDMDSLFEKIVSNLERLPQWMMPQGFDWKTHRRKLKIRNPTSRNMINGESTTDNSGRGGRATVRIYDEAAFVPSFLNVWGTGANSTNHRIAVSSESIEQGDDFYRLRTAEARHRPSVLLLNYDLHPDHDDQWLEDIHERFNGDEEKFQREVLRNPHAGFGGFVYPQTREVHVGAFPWRPGMALYVGIDPGFDDETAIVWVAYDPASGRYRLVAAYENNHLPPEFYADLIRGDAPLSLTSGDPRFLYEGNGIYNTRELMAWTKTACLNRKPSIFGDPAGSQRHTGHSFYDGMEKRWSRAEWPMTVQSGWDSDQRHFQGRRTAMMNLLQRLDFDDRPDVQNVLHALRETRFRNKDGRAGGEQKTPDHDQWSHLRTALEYIAVNLTEMQSIRQMDLTPRRISGSRFKQRMAG